MTHGALKSGDAVELRIDESRRRRLRANHSVTHLLHQALRRRLGEHVTQKGSLVAPDRLRFDFSHPRRLTDDDIAAIEAEVNDRIRDNAEVATRLMTPERAVAEGALALFGEKYGDEVRVVAMGGRHATARTRPFSVELCGGTHVRRTGDIGLFKIVVGKRGRLGRAPHRGADRRRGRGAISPRRRALLRQAAGALRTSPAELPARVAQPGRGAPPARARARRGAARAGERRRPARNSQRQGRRRASNSPAASSTTCRQGAEEPRRRSEAADRLGRRRARVARRGQGVDRGRRAPTI